MLIVNGTSCAVKMGNWNNNTGTAMIEYSVDGGSVQTKALGTLGAAMTLFTGLTDTEHTVELRGTGSFTDGVYIPIANSDAIVVTGADPKWRVAQHTYASGDGIIRNVAPLTADAGNYSPPYQVYSGYNPYHSPMTVFDVGPGGGELFVSNHGGGDVFVSFDGADPQIISVAQYGGHILIPDGTSRVWLWTTGVNSGGFYSYLSFGTDVAPAAFPALPGLYHISHSIGAGVAATGGAAGTDIPRTAIALGHVSSASCVAGEGVISTNTRLATELSRYPITSVDTLILDIGRNDNPSSAMTTDHENAYDGCITKLLATNPRQVLCLSVMEGNGEDFSPWNNGIAARVAANGAANLYYVDRARLQYCYGRDVRRHTPN